MLRKNQEREQILKLGRKLHLDVGVLQHNSDGNSLTWDEMRDTMYELHSRLRVLDVALCGEYDHWFFTLKEYVDAVVQTVLAEPGQLTSETRKALHDAEQHHKPNEIFLNMEEAIRMEFFDFKNKWDAALPS